MKKLSVLFLSLCMVMSMSVLSFADTRTIDDAAGSELIDVTVPVTVNESGVADAVCDVELNWTIDTGDLQYDKVTKYEWDPVNLSYSEVETEVTPNDLSEDPTISITITNKSNVSVGYNVAYSSPDNLIISEQENENGDLAAPLPMGTYNGGTNEVEFTSTDGDVTAETGIDVSATYTAIMTKDASTVASSGNAQGTFTVTLTSFGLGV